MQFKLDQCPNCWGAVIEIDHYGERLIGCINCNRWTRDYWLFLPLLEIDLEALKRRIEPLDE